MIEIRWHGRGGQGAFTAARLLGLAASIYEGKHTQAFPLFGPERRGAPVLSFTRISDTKIHDRSDVEACDYVVVLDDTLFGPAVLQGLKKGGVLVINSPSAERFTSQDGSYRVVNVDATKLALEVLNRPITNIPMLGALAAAVNLVTLESLLKACDDQLAPSIREKNKKLLRMVYASIGGGGEE